MAGPVEFIVAAFPEQNKAEEILKKMKQMDKDGSIQVLNAAVLKKNESGKVSVKETEDIDARRGALFGALAGGIVGLLGGPAGVLVGAAAGAATGGVAANAIDMGFDNQMLKEIQEELKPGSSAILALIEHEWVDKVVDILEEFQARLVRQAIKGEIVSQITSQMEQEDQKSEGG